MLRQTECCLCPFNRASNFPFWLQELIFPMKTRSQSPSQHLQLDIPGRQHPPAIRRQAPQCCDSLVKHLAGESIVKQVMSMPAACEAHY